MPRTRLDKLAVDIKRAKHDRALEAIVGRWMLSGISANELADTIGRHPNTVYRIMDTPLVEWPLGRVIAVADKLGIPRKELFEMFYK